LQLERRVSFRRAMKKALQTAKDFGAEGIKIRCAGRLGGAELARVEKCITGAACRCTRCARTLITVLPRRHGLRQARHQVLDLQGRKQAAKEKVAPPPAGRLPIAPAAARRQPNPLRIDFLKGFLLCR
jgi:hypothetical protein